MPKFYCDYCDRYLAHGSFHSRRQHAKGKKHQDNVRRHFSQYLSSMPPFPGGIPFPPMMAGMHPPPIIPGMLPPPPPAMLGARTQPLAVPGMVVGPPGTSHIPPMIPGIVPPPVPVSLPPPIPGAFVDSSEITYGSHGTPRQLPPGLL